MDKCYQCDRKQYKDLFNDYYSIFGVLWRFDGRCRVDYSVQTEQKDERQVDIESMFVDAMKKGHGIAWELDLPIRAFGGRRTAKVCSQRAKWTNHSARSNREI